MKKIPASFALLALMAFLTARLVVESGHHVLPVFVTAALFAAAEVLHSTPSGMAKLFVHRWLVMALVVVFTVTACCAVGWAHSSELPLLLGAESGRQFLIGMLAGVAIRMLYVTAFRRVLGLNGSRMVEALRVAAVGVYIWLFPSGVLGISYQAGLAVGLWIHLIVRSREQTTTIRARSVAHILHLLKTSPAPSVTEREALQLFLRGKWRPLRGLLNSQNPNPTTGLVFIRALYLMTAGHYPEARLLAEAELKRPSLNRELEHLLIFVQAQCLRDCDGPPMVVLHLLDRVLKLMPCCSVAATMKALCLAEQKPFLESLTSSETAHALKILGEASVSIGSTANSVWRNLVRHAFPIRMTELIDAEAFILLKSGLPSVAKPMLALCIQSDPRYSRTYLHLAEYCYVQLHSASPLEQVREALHVGLLCLAIVKELERHPNAIARRADALLGAFEQFADGGDKPNVPKAA